MRRLQQLRKASAPAMLNKNAGISFINYTESASHNCRQASSMTVAQFCLHFTMVFRYKQFCLLIMTHDTNRLPTLLKIVYIMHSYVNYDDN